MIVYKDVKLKEMEENIMRKSTICKLLIGGVVSVAAIAAGITISAYSKREKDTESNDELTNILNENLELEKENEMLVKENEMLKNRKRELKEEHNNQKRKINKLKNEVKEIRKSNENAIVAKRDADIKYELHQAHNEEIDRLHEVIEKQHDEILTWEVEEERERNERAARKEARDEIDKKYGVYWNAPNFSKEGAHFDELDKIWDQEEIIEKSKLTIDKLKEVFDNEVKFNKSQINSRIKRASASLYEDRDFDTEICKAAIELSNRVANKELRVKIDSLLFDINLMGFIKVDINLF